MSNLVAVNEISKEQMALIKATVAKGASDDELKLFLYRCKNMGLDPLKPGQIHFVKYNNSPGTMIIGIDGFRSRAAATGKHTGTKRGILRNEKGECIGAFCEVFRSDWKESAREEVSLVEYNTGKAQWQKMPETMIKKVAEVAALRMAFPDELGGMYSDDEMHQAETGTEPKVLPPSTNPLLSQEVADHQPGEYKPTFGKFKGKILKEVDMFELDNYVTYLKDGVEKSGNPAKPFVAEFLTAAENYLISLEPPESVGA